MPGTAMASTARSISRALSLDPGEIGINHHSHQFRKRNLRFPGELAPRLGSVSAECVDVRWSRQRRVDFDKVTKVHVHVPECDFDKLLERVLDSRSNHKIVRGGVI